VEARRLVDGRPLWRLAGEATTAIHHSPDRCVFVNASGELIVANADTGRVPSRAAVAAPGSVPLVAPNGIVIIGEGRLERLGSGGEAKGALVFGPADLGALTSPLILYDSCVYAGVRGRGLICVGAKQQP
jgi:hypothetical protein